jgi:hypothetical protein
MSISLNGFKVELLVVPQTVNDAVMEPLNPSNFSISDDHCFGTTELLDKTFKAYVQELPNNQEVKPLREAFGDEWFFHWREGLLYSIPKVETPQQVFGKLKDLSCNDHLQLLTSRITDLLPEIFSKYTPIKQKPFTFLAQRKEIVSEIIKTVNDLPTIVSGFKILPKYILEPKIFALHNGKADIGLFLRLKTNWQIQVSLNSLQTEGVQLQNLYVVRRHSALGQRRLVGRIDHLSQNIVYLSESFDGIDSIHEGEVWLEGSKMSFKHCLKTIIGEQYDAFEAVRTSQESQLLIGPALDTTLTQMQEFLFKQSPLKISPNLHGIVSDRIEVINTKAGLFHSPERLSMHHSLVFWT